MAYLRTVRSLQVMMKMVAICGAAVPIRAAQSAIKLMVLAMPVSICNPSLVQQKGNNADEQLLLCHQGGSLPQVRLPLTGRLGLNIQNTAAYDLPEQSPQLKRKRFTTFCWAGMVFLLSLRIIVC